MRTLRHRGVNLTKVPQLLDITLLSQSYEFWLREAQRVLRDPSEDPRSGTEQEP